MNGKRNQMFILDVNLFGDVIQGGLGHAVAGDRHGVLLHPPDGSHDGANGDEFGLILGSFQQRCHGREEDRRTDDVDLERLVQVRGRRGLDARHLRRHPGVGDDDVETGDPVLVLELLDGRRGVGLG